MTRVSIVTPAFNAMPHLPEAVASVQAQSLQDWELIVVDDGSTDGTGAWLDGLSDPRIRVVHQPNRGVGAARNAALDIARGEFVTFLDADDALPPESLAARVARLDGHRDADIVDGPIRILDATFTRMLKHRMPGEDGPFLSRLLRLDSRVFFSIAYMLPRAVIGKLRFRTDMTHCEDILFFAEVADRPGFKYVTVDSEVYCYRSSAASAMANLEGLERGYFQLVSRCRALTHAQPEDLTTMVRRVRRILFRSWIRRGRLDRAMNAAWRLSPLGRRRR